MQSDLGSLLSTFEADILTKKDSSEKKEGNILGKGENYFLMLVTIQDYLVTLCSIYTHFNTLKKKGKHCGKM